MLASGTTLLLATLIMLNLVVAANANASLVSQDLSITGDGLLTYDSNTGLSWLDLTKTVGQSYDAVLSGYGGFTTSLSFRFATGSEVAQLRTNAGITGVRSTSWDTANINKTRALMNLLGVLKNDGHSLIDLGYIADINPLGQGNHALATFAVNDIGEYDAYIPGYDPPNSFFSYATDPSYQANRQGIIGSLLVKDASTVPLPASVWLMGSALAGSFGLGAHRRTKVK